MDRKKGIIVLMGSGELTSTMVEVHKEILSRLRNDAKAVFLDTPAGFQLNSDQLSERAAEYFKTRVGYSMSVASFKSKGISSFEAEHAYSTLRDADFVLVGPGSPTYAVRQWKDTPVPDILTKMVQSGGCLVAASAAALTVGRFTMPVYEIYKVGNEPVWVDGADIMGAFGFNLVIVPHWNNAEGGTHDTRFCFIGEARFRNLVSMLPEDAGIMGLDEHTACIIDLEKELVQIRGIGTVTIRYGNIERILHRDNQYPLSILRGETVRETLTESALERTSQEAAPAEEGTLWNTVHDIDNRFQHGLKDDIRNAVNALLDLDKLIWKAKQDLESEEFITQSRDMFREMIILLGGRIASSPKSREECLDPLVRELISLREQFRKERKWKEADLLRGCLQNVGILIEDTEEGSRWRPGH